jgi:hypothetical protein
MEIHISKEQVENIVKGTSISLVGKICKRFEILGNRELLKSNIKEIVYEEFRALCNLLLARGSSKDTIIFKNKQKPHKDTIVFNSNQSSRKEWKKL